MVQMHLEYLGNLKVKAQHGPSEAIIHTAAPIDNNGDGSSFSPTDLLCTSLASCILTILGIRSKDLGWKLEGLKVLLKKHMTTEPRRIGCIKMTFQVPQGFPKNQQASLQQMVFDCPVCHSINEQIELDYEFIFEE